MTSAPSAPLTMSSHMNPKRSWPGVPNRYNLQPGSMVTLPKSSATVVVVLSGTSVLRSTPRPTAVIVPSVLSGTISDIDRTAVVLPTPNPPAMTDLTGSGCWPLPDESNNALEPTYDPLNHLQVVAE